MKKYISIIVAFLVIPVALLIPVVTGTSASTTCTLSLTEFKKAYFTDHTVYTSITLDNNNHIATASIKNNTDCNIPMSFYTYKMFDNHLYTQELFDQSSVTTIAPHTTQTITNNLTSCMTQSDIYYGTGPTVFTSDNPYLDTFGAALNFNTNSDGQFGYFAFAKGNFCKHEVIPVTPNPTISCAANPSSVQVGNTVSWTSNVATGTAPYSYSWTGSDSFSASTSVATRIYNSAGTKNATVTVTDANGKTASAQCSVTVTSIPVTTPDLTVSCAANPTSGTVGTNVIWNSTVSGGVGSYKYVWSGTNGLSGTSSTASLTYSASGTKDANVSVTSGSSTVAAICHATITDTPPSNPPQEPPTNPDIPVTVATFDATCAVNPSAPQAGQTVTFTANPFGGNGNYTYVWSGPGFSGTTSQSVSAVYTSAGNYSPQVVITSNNRSITKTCPVTIGAGTVSVSSSVPNQVAGIYLTQVPYTGVADNAGVILTVLVATLALGYIAWSYSKKREAYAYATSVSIVPSTRSLKETFSETIEQIARTNSASISSDAIAYLYEITKGNAVSARSLIEGAVSQNAADGSEWTLITLEVISRKSA